MDACHACCAHSLGSDKHAAEMRKCVISCTVCAQACALCLQACGLGHARASHVMRLCVKVCKDCENECGRHKHHAPCQACARACRACRVACTKALQRRPSKR